MPAPLANLRRLRLRTAPRSLAIRGLHLGALWAAGFAQPLFDVLEGNAAFFAIRGSEPVDIVVFAVALVTVVPLVLLALEALADLFSESASRVLHLVFVGALGALICLQILLEVSPGGSGAVLVPAALVAGGLAALAYWRVGFVRSFMTAVSPAPLFFLVAFLFFSPVTKLVLDSDEGVAVASGVKARAPVIVVVFDQMPLASLLAEDGRIDPELYPNFAALSKDSYWFRNAATTSDMTELAVPAILTGNRPAPTDLPILRDNPHNLFTLFGGSHTLHATEATTHLCPQDLCAVRTPGFSSRMRSLTSDLSVVARHMILPEDMRRGLPSIAYQWQDFGKKQAPGADEAPSNLERLADAQRAFDNRRETFSAFASSIEDGGKGRPPLHFLHSMVPHYPFEYMPSGRNYGMFEQLPGLEGLRWTDNRQDVARGYQRHLLQVAFVDRLVGQLVRHLKEIGIYDKSLLVVTADHGATFRPDHRLLGWSGRDLPTIMPVPLFIKAPGEERGRTVDTNIQTIDILPTIADLLGTKPPWKLDGHSAFGPGANRRDGLMHHPGEEPLPFTFAASHAALAEALREKLALFGRGDGFDGLFGIGPRPELLGRRVEELPAVPAGGLRGNIERTELLLTADPRSTFVPAHLTGDVTGAGSDTPKDLAIAINGVVQATARTTRVPGSEALRFSAIVPEAPLLHGADEVQLLAVTPAGALAPLATVRSQTGRYTLRGDEIRAAGRGAIRIDPKAVTGRRDPVSTKDGATGVSGWAFRSADRRPADRILAFTGNRLVYAGAPALDRPDVAEAYSLPSAARLGFSFAVDVDLARKAGERLRIFAVAGSTATEIQGG